MAQDFLYVPFNAPYSGREIQHWLEYLSREVPCSFRIPHWGTIRGTVSTDAASLEFLCYLPEGGTAKGFSFTHCAEARAHRSRLNKPERVLLEKIHRANRNYRS
jgi:hypothetical protein